VNQINISESAEQLDEDDEIEIEAMRKDSFSFHIMRFEPGDEDSMHAHSVDEIYHVDTGKATLVTEEESIEVEPGDVVHLEPETDHQFTDFEGEFVVTVTYAPAEGSE